MTKISKKVREDAVLSLHMFASNPGPDNVTTENAITDMCDTPESASLAMEAFHAAPWDDQHGYTVPDNEQALEAAHMLEDGWSPGDEVEYSDTIDWRRRPTAA